MFCLPCLEPSKMTTFQEEMDQLATFDMESKETWEQDWKTDKPSFHADEVNAMLIKHLGDLTVGRSEVRVLVPLCGKSLDMVWLADQGHSVFGVELIRKGIEDFFHGNKLIYTEESVTLSAEKQGTVFKATGKNITLFECSIFDFSFDVSGGQFDCIWDRGSMTAISMMKKGRLQQYTDTMLSCLKPDGRYLLEFFAPDSSREVPPSQFRFISEDTLIDLFSERCSIRFLEKTKLVESKPQPEQEEHSKPASGETEELVLFMYYYLMTFK